MANKIIFLFFYHILLTNKNHLTIIALLFQIESIKQIVFRSVAQSGSAPGLGPGGRRFESFHSDHLDI